MVAFKRSQVHQLFFVFHTLGDNLEFEAVCHGDDGFDDFGIVRIFDDVLDEGSVDLQSGQRKFFQIIERRVACTEIINRDMYPQL